jgi:hypothetical protein
MAAAAEINLGAMLPVFSFQYASLDPKLLALVKIPAGSNGWASPKGLDSVGPPIWKT